MLRTFCEFSPDYLSLLKHLKDPLNLRASERVIQFPYVLPAQEEKTEEELARLAEKRKEQIRKLQELAAAKRAEKMAQKEEDLQYLLNLRDEKGSYGKRDWAVCGRCSPIMNSSNPYTEQAEQRGVRQRCRTG